MYIEDIEKIYAGELSKLKYVEDVVSLLIKEHPRKEELMSNIKHCLDCTRWNSQGTFRIVQTIDFTYKAHMYEAVLIGKRIIEDNAELYKFYKELYDIHQANLKYETKVPPVIYDKVKPKKKSSNSKPKACQTTIPGFEATKRETTAERKRKAKALKINKLSINFIKHE